MALQNFLKIQECDWDIGVQTISGSFRGALVTCVAGAEMSQSVNKH